MSFPSRSLGEAVRRDTQRELLRVVPRVSHSPFAASTEELESKLGFAVTHFMTRAGGDDESGVA
jgi:hypothetical protein